MKPQFQTIEEQHRDALMAMRKEKAFMRFLEKEMPNEIKDIVHYYLSNFGPSCIRVFFELKKNMTDDEIMDLISFGKYMKSRRFTFEKFFRDSSGRFAYKMERDYPFGANYIMFFENAPNIDGCEIKEKTIEQKVYYSDCGELNKKF